MRQQEGDWQGPSAAEVVEEVHRTAVSTADLPAEVALAAQWQDRFE